MAAGRSFGPTRLHRVATLGVSAVLAAVSGFAVWSSLSTSSLGQQAIASNRLSDHYAAAAAAVAAEESVERMYRLQPTPKVRVHFDEASASLLAALRLVSRDGAAEDRAVAQRVVAAHALYLVASARLFAAADRGDVAEVARIDDDEADPLFNGIQRVVGDAAAAHHAAAIATLEELREREAFNARATPAVFLLGLVLVLLLGGVLRATRRQLEAQREQALHASLHDALTGLPNRALLARRFEAALQRGRLDGAVTGLLLIDVDRFKEVNDTLGHDFGDRLLAQIGHRLAGELRNEDTIARLGGDEFAVLLTSVDGVDGAVGVADRLQRALTAAFDVDGVQLHIEASIGVVVSGAHGDDAVTLLQRADVAMYAAKQHSRGVTVYDSGADGHSPQRLALLGQLRRGVERGELLLHYQPKVDLRSGRVTGVEALVRWQHPERGMVRPDEFIPLAERTGLIGPLTRCVLGMALAQVRAWSDAGHRIPVAVNISARNLLDDRLVGQITELLAQHGLPARMLKLEVTESAIMLEPQRAQGILNALHALGVAISIDDFGAGYTSLAQLKQLPITEIKVDKSFVLTMHSDHANALIVRSVIDLGHNLGLSVVAEGVETATAIDALKLFECDAAQGYHICRPQPAEALLRWVRDRGDGVQPPPAAALRAPAPAPALLLLPALAANG